MPPRRATATPARGSVQVDFSPQAQELPLNPAALSSLDNLKRGDFAGTSAALKETLDRAAKLLADTVGQINDRASEEKTRRQTRLQRLRKDGGEESEQQVRDFEEYQNKVESLTKKMDESVRKVVDDQVLSEKNPEWIRHVFVKSSEIQERNLRREEDEEGEHGGHAREQDVPGPLDPSQHSTALLHAARSTAETEWTSQTLTQRYSRNNTYADFYKMVWDAKNPGEQPPPLPHPSMWFASQEGRNGGRGTQRATQRSTIDDPEDVDESMSGTIDEDTEIQMTSDVRSVKCPLSMVYFTEPVTSTLCPHSFERTAVIDFIRGSDKRLPLTAEQENDLSTRYPRGNKARPQAEALMRSRNPKCVQCPVPGCTVQTLTEKDLRFDNVLLRMTKRAQEAEKRSQEEGADDPEDLDDEDSDDDILGGTQRNRKKKRVYAIGSSPVLTEGRRRTLIKPERQVSVVPNSQNQGRSPTLSQRGQGSGGFVHDEEDDDDDDVMEE